MLRNLSFAAVVAWSAFFLNGCGGNSTFATATPSATPPPTVTGPSLTISSVAAASNPIGPSGKQTLTVSASSSNNEALTYSWALTGGWTVVSGQGTASLVVQAPATYSASGSATVTVGNPSGGAATAELGLGTTGDPLPIIASIAASSSPVNAGAAFTLTANASGTAGAALTYAWTVPTGWTINSGQGTAQLSVTAPNAYLQAGNFTVAVSNNNGGAVNGQITVSTAGDPVPTLAAITPSGNPVGKAATFTLSAFASGASGDTLGYAWTVPNGWTLNSGQGTTTISVTAPGLYNASGNFTLTVNNGNGGSVNGQIFITTAIDPPPTLSSLVASSNPVMINGAFTIAATAAGAPGDAFSYAWTVPSGWTVTGGQGTAILNVTAPNTYQSSGNITLTVANGNGGSVNGQITVSTTTDPLPTINSVTASPASVTVGGIQTITASASSPSGDTLAYAWTVPPGWTITSGQGTPILTVAAPQTYATSGDVSLTVSNPSGGSINAVAQVSTGSDVVASVAMEPTIPGGGYLVGPLSPLEFTLYGDQEQTFTVTAYDVNNVPIVGAGAPAITVTGTSGLSITAPQSAASRVWGIANTVFNTRENVTLTAASAGGAIVAVIVPVLTRHLVYYLANFNNDTVAVYNEEGASPVQTISVPGSTGAVNGLAVSDEGTIAVPLGIGGVVLFSGNQSFTYTTGISSADNACIDHFGNVYVTDNGHGGLGQVHELSVVTGTVAEIATYTTDIDDPVACAIDINNGLYVTNFSTGSVVHFPYGSVTPDDSWTVITDPANETLYAVAVDRLGTVYVGLNDTGALPRVLVYPQGSHNVAFTLSPDNSGLGYIPTGLSLDIAGNLWVNNFCSNCAPPVQMFTAPLSSASIPISLPYSTTMLQIGGTVMPHQ